LVQLEAIKELTVCNILTGFYRINEHGEIFSKKANNKLRLKTDKDGYYAVSLCTNELAGAKEHKRKMFRVAGLVLREFGGEPSPAMNDPTVEHKDGNKKNNHVSNLCWMERNENSRTRKRTCPGEKNGSAKLTEENVAEIKKLLSYHILTLREIGELYGVQKSTISNIKRGQTWANVGIGSTGSM